VAAMSGASSSCPAAGRKSSELARGNSMPGLSEDYGGRYSPREQEASNEWALV